MRKLLMIALAAGAAIATVSPVQAAQGCGPGFHRGPYGGCRPNRWNGPRPRAGVYYQGRGYWNNGAYWRERYRYHNGWRYR